MIVDGLADFGGFGDLSRYKILVLKTNLTFKVYLACGLCA
jgi:hypothetical protein